MKLSLAWLFDHIDADWRSIDIQKLVNAFNKKVAEIEGFEKITIDTKNMAAARVTVVHKDSIAVEILEWKKTATLPFRQANVDQIFLVNKKDTTFEWTSLSEFASQKEGLLPAIHMTAADLSGKWKKAIEADDVIIHLDNKSINHRPDMWGHRGVAREIAALLNLPFRALDHMLIAHDVQNYKNTSAKNHTFSIEVEDQTLCKKFSGLYFNEIQSSDSIMHIAIRLAKVDSRPINAIVDATNYIMLDIGQPMHAFDANKLADKHIEVRHAKNKETILLLDGSTVTLCPDDCVVTDGKSPIALAGIMGGKESAVDDTTKAIFLEAACFDASMIRKTSLRVKKRTESSARFEKNLDPAQTTIAIKCFLKLFDDAHIWYQADDIIISVGTDNSLKELSITHSYIEQLLGISVTSSFVINALTKLGFGIVHNKDSYMITVPSFRATKDIAIKQDIVEEIGRLYGYDTIADQLPSRVTEPFDLTTVMRTRAIKELLAYSFDMRELYTYAFFDESFLSMLGWDPGKTLQVQEAVSHNWQRLVTSLIPNLLKAVHVHAPELDVMNFFEWANIWPDQKEQSSLAGIFVNQKSAVDFYEYKQKLSKLMKMLDLDVQWIKVNEKDCAPWYLAYQTAHIVYQDKIIGTTGKINPALFAKVATGDAFIFELEGSFLLSYKTEIKRYMPASKYPTIMRDVSMLIPLSITVDNLKKSLLKIDDKIMTVDLVDFFQKPEWHDKKSLTFRLVLNDSASTMTNTQADAIMQKVTTFLQNEGAQIR